jgi:succinyl-CoA synthetase beta subunit
VIFLNLLEYEAKRVFSKHGIPTPKSETITDFSQTAQAVAKLKPPFMIKAQIRAGGRGKAGGVIPAATAHEAEEATAKLLGGKLKGLPVEQVMIEEKLSIRKELYVGITLDRSHRSYVALVSAVGGVEIEETAEKMPAAVIRTIINPRLGMLSFHAVSIARQLRYCGDQLVELAGVVEKLYQVCVENDAELVEINPLAETETGSFVAADARMVIDDNALFRHPEYRSEETRLLSPSETLAAEKNLAYVKLEGDIGVVGNGAGLVMATLDLLNLAGGKPANFLDLGGGAAVDAIRAALEIVLTDSDVKIIIVNVLGGITRCDEVAQGIVEALNEAKVKKPLVARLVGVNQEEGQRILFEHGIRALDSMEEAVRRAVELVRRTTNNGNNS